MNQNRSLCLIFELHLSGQFPFVEGIYKILSKQKNIRILFSLLDEEFENIKTYLQKFGIDETNLIPASRVPSIRDVDLFLSPTNWTQFLPSQDIPKIQLFHSLIYKNTIFAGQFDKFNIIFSPGEYHNEYYRDVYLKQFPGLKKKQALYDIGYPKLDDVINGNIDGSNIISGLGLNPDRPTVIYAPTWELTASLHTKGLAIINMLAALDMNVLVKLHPMSYRDPKFAFANGGIDWKAVMASVEKKYANVKNILDPNANPYLIASDLMVTDASGVGLEFMATNKPLVFIDVPEFFESCGYGGIEDKCRIAGELVKDVKDLPRIVMENLANPSKFEGKRKKFVSKLLFNPGNAAEKAAEKILEIMNDSRKGIISGRSDLLDIKNAKKSANAVDGFLTDEEGKLLYTLANNCKGNGVIVEIGSWKGKSTIWLGKGSKAGNKVKIYAVDPHSGTPAHRRQKVTDTFTEFMNNTKNAQVDDIVTPIVKPANKAAEIFNEPIEMIFIDGDHEYESAKLDYELWFPKLVDGGIILFHDSAGHHAWPGVKKFVDELFSEPVNLRNKKVVDSITYAEKVRQSAFDEKSAIEKSEQAYEKGLTSIIVIALNGLDYTKRCIESIRKYTNLPYELIVIDNGSTDGTLEYLKEQKDVKLIANTENVGAPFARNQGLQIAKGEYIMFFDNDIVATENWLDILVDHAVKNPAIGLIGPMSNYVSGPQFVPSSDFEDLSKMHEFAKKFSEKNKGKLMPAYRLILYAMFAKREVVQKIGGFDPLYGKWGFEDDDYCLRAVIAGFKLAISTDVFIYHKGSSTSRSANIDYNKLLENNWENFKRKWGLPKYLSYMQGYPINLIVSQPFDKEKHYCSLIDRRSGLEADAVHRFDLSPAFVKSRIEELGEEQKNQFALFNAIDECEGSVLEIGYPTPDLAAMIAVKGLATARLTEKPEECNKCIHKFGLNNLSVVKGSLSELSSLANTSFDTVIVYFDEAFDARSILELLDKIKETVKPSGKIVVVCKTNYKTRTSIRTALKSFADFKYNEMVPSVYILASYRESDSFDADLIIQRPEKIAAGKKVSIMLIIDESFNDNVLELKDCVDRLLLQTYQGIELVVCNLTKSRDIREVLKSYLPRLNYIESGKPLGEVIQYISSETDCDYLTILNPSDLLMPKAIDVMSNALTKSSCDAVCADAVYFIENTSGIRMRWSARILSGSQAIRDQLIGNRILTSASMIKRVSLQKVFKKEARFGDDFHFGFWLYFLANRLKIEAVNLPVVLHKLTRYEESIFQGTPQILEDFSQLRNTDKTYVIKKFIKDFPVNVISPINVGGMKPQLLSAVWAFRASVLIQNRLYKEAIADIASATKKMPADKDIRRDIKELAIFSLMKSIELNDFELIGFAAKLVLKLDSSNALAKLHLIRIEIEKSLEVQEINIQKLKEFSEELFELHAENKFDAYQFLCYGLLATLAGNKNIANKMFEKSLSMNIPLPAISTAKKKAEQHLLISKSAGKHIIKQLIQNIEGLLKEKTLSLAMIVKNEEDNLVRCLKSVEGVVDEIVVVDTGSTDRTMEIARSFDAKVIESKWKNDFSEARNISIDHSTSDWVMFLDADEELVEEDKETLLSIKNDPVTEGFLFTINNFAGNEAGEDIVSNLALRMWRNRLQHRFEGTLHEQIIDKIRKSGVSSLANVRVNHYGYLNKLVIDKNKIERNLDLAKKIVEDEPRNSFAHFNLGVEYVRTRDYEKALGHFDKSEELLSHKNAYFAHFLSLNRIQMLMFLKRYDEALALVEEEIMKYPDFPELIFEKAVVYLNTKDFINAIGTVKYLINLQHDIKRYISHSGVTTFRAYHLLGMIYETIGDKKSAVSWYSRAFQTNSRYIQNMSALLRMLLKTDNERKVKEYVDKHVDDKDPLLLTEIGSIFLKEGKSDTALDYLNTALEMDKKAPPKLLFLLGKSNLYSRDKEAAEKFFTKVPKTSEYYMESCLELALCYGLKNDFNNLKDILTYISAEEQLTPYVTVLSSLFDLKEFDNGSIFSEEAAGTFWQILKKLISMQEFEYFEKALKLCSRLNMEEGVIALNLGKLYDDGGFKDLAAQQYLNALNKGYCDSESLISLGDECDSQELIQDAINFYSSATQTAPQLITSYLKLAKLLVKQREYFKAEEVLEECNKKFPESELIKQALLTMKNIFTSSPSP